METIKLDLIPGKKMPSLHASQYDDGREHGIDLFENGVVYKLDGTETLTINERKGDDCICSLDIENDFADTNHIVFASTEQMCAVWGNNICELVIAKCEKTIGTLNFILEVEPSPTEGGIESESEIKNLKRQIEAITEEVIGDDYYTAEETDEAIENATEGKADTTYVNTELAKKADKTDTYTKTQVDNSLNLKADKNNPTFTGTISHYRRSGTTVGNYSVALGFSNISSGSASFAEGSNTIASANNAHAEGNATEASARFAHAEGRQTVASAEQSHAEGYNTTASGNQSHAEGNGTEAKGSSQHVSGKYNIVDNNNAYAEIIGNGTSESDRSNARTLDWSGNETLAGDLTYNGNKSLTSEISRLDGKIDNLPAPMIFKGTLGVGGTIQTLPTASASNEGFTYKVITDGTYAGQTAKVGDVFTSNGSAWVYIPSGDEDNDTWRAIKVNGVEKLGNGISSGAVDFEDTTNVKFEFDANGNKVKATLDGIYTESDVDDLLDDKADADNTYTKAQVDDIVYGILPDDTSSGSVANFTTSLELPIKSLEVDVNAVQESGTPTPSSPKAISGWNAITLDVNGNTEVINLGGTYYGGHFTQDKAGHRQFKVTHKYALLNDETLWVSTTGTVTAYYNYAIDDRKTFSTSTEGVICSAYRIGTSNGYARWVSSTSSRFGINDNTVTFDDIKTLARNGDIAIVYEIAVPIIIDLPDGEPIITLNGTNNIYADTGDCAVEYKCSVAEYVANHSGGSGAKSLGGVFLGGSNSGSEEEPTEESEDTEKTKEIDEPKEEIKTIGEKKLGGE